jgi:hypothetical protein
VYVPLKKSSPQEPREKKGMKILFYISSRLCCACCLVGLLKPVCEKF